MRTCTLNNPRDSADFDEPRDIVDFTTQLSQYTRQDIKLDFLPQKQHIKELFVKANSWPSLDIRDGIRRKGKTKTRSLIAKTPMRIHTRIPILLPFTITNWNLPSEAETLLFRSNGDRQCKVEWKNSVTLRYFCNDGILSLNGISFYGLGIGATLFDKQATQNCTLRLDTEMNLFAEINRALSTDEKIACS